MPIHRITMFKVLEDGDIQKMIDQYKVVSETNKKDGKPYILSCTAHKPIADPRSQGFNLIAYCTFASQADVKYYDEECEAHNGLKALAKGKISPPPMTVMWEAS